MEKFFNYIGKIATIISIIGGCVAIYFAFNEKQIKLDIQTTNVENLTTHKAIQNLSVRYYYLDSIEVCHLWKMQWLIRNTGDKTIIGYGADSQLLNEGLQIRLDGDVRIFSIDITNSSNGATLKDRSLHFKQWRKDEYVEITAFIESDKEPRIEISDRDIVDSEISYSIYTPDIAVGKGLIIEYFPKWLGKTLKIIYLILAAITILAGIATIFSKKNDTSSKMAMIIVILFMLIPMLWLI